MFESLKYKVWKKLTKKWVRNIKVREAAFAEAARMKTRAQSPPVCMDTSEEEYEKHAVGHQIIDVMGMLYSGSSAVIGLLGEFDNVDTYGFEDSVWSKKGMQRHGAECTFFSHSGFWGMVNAFGGDPLQCDIMIKRFIINLNRYYDNKGQTDRDRIIDLYGEHFHTITHKFLCEILAINDYTRSVMQKRAFPVVSYTGADDDYTGCSFVKGEGKQRYYFYEFASLSKKEFHERVATFLVDFFSILGNKNYIAYDHLLFDDHLENINKYITPPVKQIVVVRDPRDQFLSAFRQDTRFLPRNVGEYKDFLERQYQILSKANPNRLYVRFEDLVLKYEDTTALIMDFIGLKKENHVRPKSVFDPAISSVNVGAYKNFHESNFMEQIGRELIEYCYNSEKQETETQTK